MSQQQTRRETLPLWRRNLYVLWLAQFLAMTGMSSCVPFLPKFITELGVQNQQEAQFWSGLVFSGPFLVSFLTTPIWSALGDKYGRKMIVLRAVFGLAASMICMGFSHSVLELLFWRIVQGAVSGFVAANLSFVSAETPKEHVGYAIGVLQSSQSAGNILGPFMGGLISWAWGMRSVFWIVGGLAIISGILIWTLLVEVNRSETQRSNASTARENVRMAFTSVDLRTVLILIVISQMSIVFTTPIFPFYLKDLGTPKEWLDIATGTFVGIVGLCTLIFAPRWGKRNDAKGYRKTIVVTAFVVGISTILQAFVPNVYLLFALRVVIGIFIAGIVPSLSTALSKLSPENIRGGIMGLASSAMLFGNLLSPPFSGWISSSIGEYGIRVCFAIAGVLMLLVSGGATRLRDIVKEERDAHRIHTHEIHA